MTSRDKTKWRTVSTAQEVADQHKVKKKPKERKMWQWIFCPQMTLHDIPKMSRIEVKLNFLPYGARYEFENTWFNLFFDSRSDDRVVNSG